MIPLSKETTRHWQRYYNRVAPPYTKSRLGRRFVYMVTKKFKQQRHIDLCRMLNNEQQNDNN